MLDTHPILTLHSTFKNSFIANQKYNFDVILILKSFKAFFGNYEFEQVTDSRLQFFAYNF